MQRRTTVMGQLCCLACQQVSYKSTAMPCEGVRTSYTCGPRPTNYVMSASIQLRPPSPDKTSPDDRANESPATDPTTGIKSISRLKTCGWRMLGGNVQGSIGLYWIAVPGFASFLCETQVVGGILPKGPLILMQGDQGRTREKTHGLKMRMRW